MPFAILLVSSNNQGRVDTMTKVNTKKSIKEFVMKLVALDVLSIAAFVGIVSVLNTGSTVLDGAIAFVVIVYTAEKLW